MWWMLPTKGRAHGPGGRFFLEFALGRCLKDDTRISSERRNRKMRPIRLISMDDAS